MSLFSNLTLSLESPFTRYSLISPNSSFFKLEVNYQSAQPLPSFCDQYSQAKKLSLGEHKKDGAFSRPRKQERCNARLAEVP